MPPMFCLYGIFHDLDKIRLLNESCDNVTDIDIEYDHFECEVSKVIDKHVPVKHRYPRKNSVRLHLFPLKQFFTDHLSIFFYKNGLTVCQKLFAL
jgi:hypothetical protein